MSQFLIGQDLLGIVPKQCTNIYWNSIIQVVSQYQQIVEIQKKQIQETIEQSILKRKQLIIKFYDYKESLKYQGQTVKKQILFLDTNQLHEFFRHYHYEINTILQKVLTSPQIFINLIKNYSGYRKYKFADFCQNIPFLVYQYYNAPTYSTYNKSLQFFRLLMRNWDYDVFLCRPQCSGAIDEMVIGYLKTPNIAAYIQKITMKFLQLTQSNKMINSYVFDEDAIQIQQQSKKQKAITFSPPPKIGFFDRLFKKKIPSTFDKAQLQEPPSQFNYSYSADGKKLIGDIIKNRKQPFLIIIQKTIQIILKQDPPQMLKQMLTLFHQAILFRYPKEKDNMIKHYSYFIMTNFILSQIHNKFTVSQDDNTLTPAALQNISQIIKVITCIFQGKLPDVEKYKSIIPKLKQYSQRVYHFYKQMIITKQQYQQQAQTQISSNNYQENSENNEIKKQFKQSKQILALVELFSQKTFMLSFNDIRIIFDMIKQSQKIFQRLEIKQNIQRILNYLKLKELSQLFESKRVVFLNNSYDAQNIIFIIRSFKPYLRDIINCYAGMQSPLKHFPFIKSILMDESNLTVSQSLQLSQAFNMIKTLPFKQMRYYLVKLSGKYNKLHIKNPEILKQKFEISLKESLRQNLQRKSLILIWKQKLYKKIQYIHKFITFFKNQLKSSAFYEKITNSFIENASIKVYLNIQNNLWKIHKNLLDFKSIKISSLMISKDINSKSTQNNDDNILRSSYKSFEKINDFMDCFKNHLITKSAMLKGRKSEQFNQTFKVFCQIVVSQIKQFLQKKNILQNLNQERFGKIVVSKLQSMIYDRYYPNEAKGNIQDDQKLKESLASINSQSFYSQDLQSLSLQKQYILEESNKVLKKLLDCRSIKGKLQIFDDFFKIIFTIISFSIPAAKISAEIINPVIQFLILQSKSIPHYQILHSLQCLKWRQQPSANYQLSLYQSSLSYIKNNLPNQSQNVKNENDSI